MAFPRAPGYNNLPNGEYYLLPQNLLLISRQWSSTFNLEEHVFNCGPVDCGPLRTYLAKVDLLPL